jgi:type I restriction enzyme S subunit
MSDDVVVPQGWTATTLGAIGDYLNGRAFKSSDWATTGRPIIRIQDLTGSNRNPNYFEGEVDARYVVRPGDFLISWSATLGAYIWDGPEAVLNQHIFKVESRIHKRFHYHLVRDRIAELLRNAHGSGMVHVTKGTFDATPVVVPDDLDVQGAIADLLDRVDDAQLSAVTHVDAARRSVGRLRQAVRAAGCVGRLSEDWRRDHPDQDDVDDLLSDLAVRRRAQQGRGYSEPELNRYAPTGVLPDSWALVPLGLLLESLKYGTSKRSEYETAGTPVLRIPNVSRQTVDLDDLKFARLDDREASDLALADGDLLMIRSNGSVELVGTTKLVPPAAVGMAYAGYLMRLRPNPNAVDPRYLEVALTSPLLRVQIEMPARSTSGVHNINTAEVRGLAIPLPSMAEQQEIIRRVDELLALTTSLARRVEIASMRIDQTSQAARTKAFRGELVPSESAPGDEERLGAVDALIARPRTISRPEAKRSRAHRNARQAT